MPTTKNKLTTVAEDNCAPSLLGTGPPNSFNTTMASANCCSCSFSSQFKCSAIKPATNGATAMAACEFKKAKRNLHVVRTIKNDEMALDTTTRQHNNTTTRQHDNTTTIPHHNTTTIPHYHTTIPSQYHHNTTTIPPQYHHNTTTTTPPHQHTTTTTHLNVNMSFNVLTYSYLHAYSISASTNG